MLTLPTSTAESFRFLRSDVSTMCVRFKAVSKWLRLSECLVLLLLRVLVAVRLIGGENDLSKRRKRKLTAFARSYSLLEPLRGYLFPGHWRLRIGSVFRGYFFLIDISY